VSSTSDVYVPKLLTSHIAFLMVEGPIRRTREGGE
jgi:hypothetical protein